MQKLQNIIWDEIKNSLVSSHIASYRKKDFVTFCMILWYWKHLLSVDTAAGILQHNKPYSYCWWY